MNITELQKILGYLNIGLAIAHDTGVTLGRFGDTDFIQLAESVNTLLLNAVAPAPASTTASSGTVSSGAAASPAVAAVAPVASLVAVI